MFQVTLVPAYNEGPVTRTDKVEPQGAGGHSYVGGIVEPPS